MNAIGTPATDIQAYEAPTSLAAALDILRDDGATILAGGTDLMPQSRAGRVRFGRTLLNIRRIPELRGLIEEGGSIRIGATATIAELHASPLVRDRLPVLWEAADHFASGQIRNAGTVGGNICNASPAGDTLVPLIVLGAEVELASKADGAVRTRRMPLAEFFTGPGRTRREPKELLTAVWVPTPPEGFRARFAKFGTRPALDISVVSVGIGGVLRDGVFRNVRVAFGAVGPTPLRGTKTQQALEGRCLDEETMALAAVAARDEVTPISDARATDWYRRELVHNLTRRMLADVAGA